MKKRIADLPDFDMAQQLKSEEDIAAYITMVIKGHGKNKIHHKSCLFARLLRCINGHIFQYAPINAP